MCPAFESFLSDNKSVYIALYAQYSALKLIFLEDLTKSRTPKNHHSKSTKKCQKRPKKTLFYYGQKYISAIFLRPWMKNRYKKTCKIGKKKRKMTYNLTDYEKKWENSYFRQVKPYTFQFSRTLFYGIYRKKVKKVTF